ncbi:MAG: hypothetical protein VR64_22880 [Desulfatitalea sp. BRH_c12]|nr:MAG: hypothetical protein VR64_22880 [Desulfatitalea sp. BRH_c12]
MAIRKRSLYALFVVILLSTEFLHIEFFGGFLRPYHFLVPLVIFSLLRFLKQIARSGLFWALIGFLSVNLLAAELAHNQSEAYRSLALLALNMSTSLAVALILVSGSLSPDRLIKISLQVAIVGVAIGVAQLVMYYLLGIDLTFTEGQASQLSAGFATGLRTEANTFAKYLNTVFLLTLPVMLADKNYRRALLIFIIIVIGMLTSLTRSALYGLFVTLIIAYIWYLWSGRGRLISGRTLLIAAIAAFALFIFSSLVIYFNPYAAHKLALFFNSEEILEGGSSGFRLMSQSVLWDAFLENTKTLLIGNGWGQVTFPYADKVYQAGGAEIVVALGYGGIVGGFFYCLYQLTAIITVARTITNKRVAPHSRAREGVLFALIGMLITGQINGAMIAPEYWMVLGMAIAIAVMGKNRPRYYAISDRGI